MGQPSNCKVFLAGNTCLKGGGADASHACSHYTLHSCILGCQHEMIAALD